MHASIPRCHRNSFQHSDARPSGGDNSKKYEFNRYILAWPWAPFVVNFFWSSIPEWREMFLQHMAEGTFSNVWLGHFCVVRRSHNGVGLPSHSGHKHSIFNMMMMIWDASCIKHNSFLNAVSSFPGLVGSAIFHSACRAIYKNAFIRTEYVLVRLYSATKRITIFFLLLSCANGWIWFIFFPLVGLEGCSNT